MGRKRKRRDRDDSDTGSRRKNDYHNKHSKVHVSTGRYHSNGFENHQGGYGARTILSQEFYVGTIINASSKGFGWAVLDQDISYIHGATSNVFVHRKDLHPGGEFKDGDRVRFQLYIDERGLGGFNISLVEGKHDGSFPCVPSNYGIDIRTTLHFFVEESFVNTILGRRGVTLRRIMRDTQTEIQFLGGTHEMPKEGKFRRYGGKMKLIKIVGSSDRLKQGLKQIVEIMSLHSQSHYSKVIFLLPDDQIGRFIGKKGANIKKIRAESGINVNISKECLTINSVAYKTVTLFGNSSNIGPPLEEAVGQLAHIFQGLERDGKLYPCTVFTQNNPLSRDFEDSMLPES